MKTHEHWCTVCDNKVVNSEDPSTGKWYVVAGHEWSGQGEFKGDYKMVLFAVCPDCDIQEYIKGCENPEGRE